MRLKLSSDKTPGTDGLPGEFYKVFWNDLVDILINALNYSYETGKHSVLQTRGIVKLIPKKAAELNLVKNWRLLTLLNCDYKIATKAIANQIKIVLPKLIRLMDNVIKYTKAKNIPGLLLFLDFEEAFDTPEWSFIQRT